MSGYTADEVRQAVVKGQVTDDIRAWYLSAEERQLPLEEQDEFLAHRLNLYQLYCIHPDCLTRSPWLVLSEDYEGWLCEDHAA